MICNSYEILNPLEKAKFIGSIQHAAMSDEGIFSSCQQLIELAKRKGIFDNVVIVPSGNDEEERHPRIVEGL